VPGSRQSTAIVAGERPSQLDVLSARPSLPDHIVYREFVNETVVLNLETGIYHGLNPSGGKMLQTLGAAEFVRDAAAELSTHYQRPLEEIERDLCAFCLDLHHRGLIELEA
jgi:Coenzyme PQQ synthesis protein D (PqqD)